MILKMSSNDMSTLPVFIFNIAMAKNAAASMINTSTNRLRLFMSLLSAVLSIISLSEA